MNSYLTVIGVNHISHAPQLLSLCTHMCSGTTCACVHIIMHNHYVHTNHTYASHSHTHGYTHAHTCWPLPSNQSFYRQIASYRRPVGDHRVGQWWKGVMGQQKYTHTMLGTHTHTHNYMHNVYTHVTVFSSYICLFQGPNARGSVPQTQNIKL